MTSADGHAWIADAGLVAAHGPGCGRASRRGVGRGPVRPRAQPPPGPRPAATAPSSDPMHRHTRSMIFSPNKPCGLNSRNTSATTYANQFSIAPPTSGPQ